MSNTIALGDQTITVQDFSAFKFLEATDMLGQILAVVPELDPVLRGLAQEHAEAFRLRLSSVREVAQIGRENLPDVPTEVWEGVVGGLIGESAPSGNDQFVRVFPLVMRKARQPTERLIALLATPNSRLEADDEASRDPYGPDGSVHETLKLVRHRSKLSQQVGLVLACIRQLTDELREADLGGQMGELRKAAAELQKALAPPSSEGPTGDETSGQPDTSGEPTSSTHSSPPTPDRSVGETSSIASPTAS